MMRAKLLLSVVVALAACSGGAGTEPVSAQQPAHRDWPRFGVDVGRSSVFDTATGITAANIDSLQRQQVTLDGTVDASPIYLHAVQINGATHDAFFVTTTYGKTMAIDADDGSVLWTFTPGSYSSLAGSYRITTATPVADPDRSALYAASPDGNIQKLAVADGHVLWTTSITKLPEREKIASSLNFYDGHVVATTGGYIGDAPPYQGHVAILDAASGNLLHVWNALCSDRAGLIDPSSCPESDAAIWGRAGAVIDSASGNIFVATGNATWDGATYWGDATLELDPDAAGIVGNYTPANTQTLNQQDLDLGSTSPALLGDGFLAQGGKDGKIRLLSIQRMQGTTAHQDDEVQIVSTPSGTDLFTAPAVMRTDSGTWLFAADNGGTAAWSFTGGTLHPAWSNGTGGTSPVVAGGLLYVYNPHGGLNVYDPSSGQRITTLDCGSGHWNSPIIVDGRIALPEGNANHHSTNGVLNIWRLP
jgi:outer membrane protein assembly factor BamB